MKRPQLGQWCELSAIATKNKTRAKVGKHFRRTESQWNCHALAHSTPAVFIGYRTVSDCVFRANGYGEEYGEEIENYNHREVWLFVTDARRKIVRAFPEDVKILETE